MLVVCGEKFSDKIGTVRTSRMIFGDGAAAIVIGPAPAGAAPDVEYYQTYASGPMSEVDSIIWPNPEFDNNITVYGPQVRALVKRYLSQMVEELRALPGGAGEKIPDSGQAAGEAMDGLLELLRRYFDPAQAYASRTAPQFVRQHHGDYDHLARVFEWSTSGEEGES